MASTEPIVNSFKNQIATKGGQLVVLEEERKKVRREIRRIEHSISMELLKRHGC